MRLSVKEIQRSMNVGSIGFFASILINCLTGNLVAQENSPSNVTAEQQRSVDIERQEALSLFKHKPIYFIYGNPDTKVQISFKTLMLDQVPIYFAYSEIIFWQLNKESKPFEDATYNPELFYRWRFSQQQLPLDFLDIGLIDHNSNGRAEEASRSFDRSYVRANLSWGTQPWNLQFSTKASYIYNQDTTNKDIYKYISPFEFDVSLEQWFQAWMDKGKVSLRVIPGGRVGEDWAHGGYELGYNFHFGRSRVYPAFYLQYYNGYAETLLNYDQHVRQFRGGFAF